MRCSFRRRVGGRSRGCGCCGRSVHPSSSGFVRLGGGSRGDEWCESGLGLRRAVCRSGVGVGLRTDRDLYGVLEATPSSSREAVAGTGVARGKLRFSDRYWSSRVMSRRSFLPRTGRGGGRSVCRASASLRPSFCCPLSLLSSVRRVSGQSIVKPIFRLISLHDRTIFSAHSAHISPEYLLGHF